jgi:hypothetical protein
MLYRLRIRKQGENAMEMSDRYKPFNAKKSRGVG